MKTKKVYLWIMLAVLISAFALSPIKTNATDDSVSVYRMYNPVSGEHLYTTSSAERDSLIGAKWNYEGIGWQAPSTGSPVYRVFNPNSGEHHYTTDEGEKNYLASIGWNYEGISFYSAKSTGMPIYRQFNPNSSGPGAHNYTYNVSEKDYLISIGWHDEAIGWYGLYSNNSSEFNLANVPPYSGSPVYIVNNNKPFFTNEDYTTQAFENYSDLDLFGRCGVAYANVCKEIMPTEPRGEIGSVRPSGWQTVKYNGIVDGNYLYNRCHLIAFQLAGENANEKNLITGTRYLNTEGMLPYENNVASYVKSSHNHVLYRVTPIFEGNNLVASGVLMEAYSVEDNGKLQFCVYCYNVQPGIVIDYATGNSRIAEGNENTPGTSDDVIMDYVLNTNTMRFHKPTCSSVSTMSEKNKSYFTGTRSELISKGYTPCGNCKP